MKFEDWWRGIRLFLKSNRIIETDNRITAILACLRGGVVEIFSDKTKAADAKWKIEIFKQGKKNTADFIIEFKALAMKADTDELHAIFLLKKNAQHNIIKIILGVMDQSSKS